MHPSTWYSRITQKNEQKSLREAIARINRVLRPFFGEMLADTVDSDEIDRWMDWRRKPQLVERIPPIKKLAENNTRKGFVTHEQYQALMAELPEHLRPITVVAYHVDNRKSELFNLEWSDVDLAGNPPVFTLWLGTTKNQDGRTLPILASEMMETFRSLKAAHDEQSKESQVFLTADGKPLRYHRMRDDWDNASTRAGVPGLLFHDLRRSAVRNLRRAGVTQTVARQFSGYKTDAVFNCYNITDFDDLKDAAAKLGRFLNQKES
jgi:integrase